MFESGEYSEWVVKENHMGFDITATRVIDYIDYYINNDAILGSENIALWITGHSRGGAISNIVGTRVIDELKEKSGGYLNGSRIKDYNNIYVYTFAAPNTTTKDANLTKSYHYIFNIVNEDDLVTRLPLSEEWGFVRYGIDKKKSVEEGLKGLWEQTSSISYSSDSKKLNDLLNGFLSLDSSRDMCYIIKHDAPSLRVELKYGKMYTEFLGRNYYYISTAYFMQYLAYIAAKSGGNKIILLGVVIKDVLNAKFREDYDTVKWSFVDYGLKYMTHPHLPVSYYVLSQKV